MMEPQHSKELVAKLLEEKRQEMILSNQKAAQKMLLALKAQIDATYVSSIEKVAISKKL